MSDDPGPPDRQAGSLESSLLPPPTAPIVEPRLPFAKALVYSSGNFGSGVFYAFNNFVLSIFLRGLGASAVLLGLLSSTRSFEGAIIQPIIGSWSDRTWTRLGRRRPFIVAFVPISALFIVVTAFVPSMQGLARSFGISPTTFVPIAVAVGIFLFTVTFNVMVDPYTALLPDITPPRQRGNVNGIFQAIGAVGQMSVLLFSVSLFGAVGSSHQATGFFILFLVTAVALVLLNVRAGEAKVKAELEAAA
jgi:Na+/melibiose symporter-like transporter